MIDLKEMARKLGLRTMVANWEKYEGEKWVEPFLRAEDVERDQRTLERRLKEAQIGQFKPMSEFDWDWPKKIDREQIEELLALDFVAKKFNAVFVSTNGLGKTMIAQNLASMAILKGYKTRFVKASQMLNHLLESDSASKRAGRLRAYCSPDLLVIDEVGYMNYDNRYADLLYEVISGRYQKASTVVTTNKGFKQWGDIFPNAACVVTMVDRLVHHAETVVIEGESYRAKEAKERAATKEKERKTRKDEQSEASSAHGRKGDSK